MNFFDAVLKKFVFDCFFTTGNFKKLGIVCTSLKQWQFALSSSKIHKMLCTGYTWLFFVFTGKIATFH